MAAVIPTPANHCLGNDALGNPVYQLYCDKGNDLEGNPIYVCATWKMFKAQCPTSNESCSSLSQAYVPAITVCNQRLF